MDFPKQLELQLKSLIESLGYELWLVEQHTQNRSNLLRLLVDHPNGVSLQDCTNIHRTLEADPIGKELLLRYSLEISSPGIFRPLKFPFHFKRFEGERIRIHLKENIGGFRKGRGILIECFEESLCFQKHAEQEIIIPFQTILKANLEPELIF